jgi:hypothetical protein
MSWIFFEASFREREAAIENQTKMEMFRVPPIQIAPNITAIDGKKIKLVRMETNFRWKKFKELVWGGEEGGGG